MGSDYMEGLISKMRAIHNPVTSFKRGKAQRPSSRQPSPGAPTGGPDRKLPGLHLFSGGATSPPLPINRRLSFPILALLAALAVALLFLLPGGPLRAQETAGTFYHHENDMGPIVPLTAEDPETVTPIFWDILEDDEGVQDLPGGNDGDDIADTDVADHAFFTVKGGVLSFKDNPDFEHSRDDTTYKVVVKASDGGLTQWVEYFKVTVILLDREEDGKVEWTVDPDGAGGEGPNQDLLEFQAGAILTATVSDPDGPVTLTNVTWKWYRSSSRSATGTVIDGAEAAAYTVSDDADSYDVGMYLRAVATYTDRRGVQQDRGVRLALPGAAGQSAE